MGSLGLPEIIFILLLALLIFGPKRLPEIGRTLGKGMAEFRKASNDLKRTINAELSLEEDEQTRTPRRIEPPASLVQAITPAAATPPAGTVAQLTWENPIAPPPELPPAPAHTSEVAEAGDIAEAAPPAAPGTSPEPHPAVSPAPVEPS
jgi:TatA/E family protein of Tat protein translocase